MKKPLLKLQIEYLINLVKGDKKEENISFKRDIIKRLKEIK